MEIMKMKRKKEKKKKNKQIKRKVFHGFDIPREREES